MADIDLKLHMAVKILEGLGYEWAGLGEWVIPIKKYRTKGEYVFVNSNNEGNKYWELARDFSEGVDEFFAEENGKFSKIHNHHRLLDKYQKKGLYRKVEREITWKDEAQKWLSDNEIDGVFFDNSHVSNGELYLRFDITEEKLVELSHLVASITDKPEGV